MRFLFKTDYEDDIRLFPHSGYYVSYGPCDPDTPGALQVCKVVSSLARTRCARLSQCYKSLAMLTEVAGCRLPTVAEVVATCGGSHAQVLAA